MDELKRLRADVAKLRTALRDARDYIDAYGRDDKGAHTCESQRAVDGASKALYETDRRRAA